MSKVSAEIEQIVSEKAWRAFPELHVAVLRWAELAKAEASEMVVSAVPIGSDWISVRLTRIKGVDRDPVDWIEGLAPMWYRGASQPAVDHFVSRLLDGCAEKLSGRAGALKGIADFPPVPSPAKVPERSEPTMAKKKPATAAAPAETTPAKPRARKPAPSSATGRPMPSTVTETTRTRPKATRPAAAMAPRAETRSGPAAAPSKPKPRKPATPKAAAAPSTKPAATPAPKPAAPKPRATTPAATTTTKRGRK